MTPAGFPHSDIFGSKLVCSSPKLFAACHVLHRLSVPRHPPFTLSSLTKLNLNLKLVFCLSFVLRRILSLLDSISCQRSEELLLCSSNSKELSPGYFTWRDIVDRATYWPVAQRLELRSKPEFLRTPRFIKRTVLRLLCLLPIWWS